MVKKSRCSNERKKEHIESYWGESWWDQEGAEGKLKTEETPQVKGQRNWALSNGECSHFKERLPDFIRIGYNELWWRLV